MSDEGVGGIFFTFLDPKKDFASRNPGLVKLYYDLPAD